MKVEREENVRIRLTCALTFSPSFLLLADGDVEIYVINEREMKNEWNILSKTTIDEGREENIYDNIRSTMFE
jgi:hypothetical protein